MKIVLQIVIISCVFFLLPQKSKAQFESFRDSVVQLYGLVMTADSLKGLEGVSIMVKGQNRGTMTNVIIIDTKNNSNPGIKNSIYSIMAF